MTRTALAALLMVSSAALAEPHRTAALAWMIGNWVHDEGKERVMESWVGPGNGMMVGTNLTAWPNGRRAFEFMRIGETPQGLSYYASPGGRPPVEFRSKELTETRVVFENLEHDFPQRVIYWKDGEAMGARIEGTLKGVYRGEEWRFKPATR
jgi:Domain of unknown function (DUF6265)